MQVQRRGRRLPAVQPDQRRGVGPARLRGVRSRPGRQGRCLPRHRQPLLVRCNASCPLDSPATVCALRLRIGFASLLLPLSCSAERALRKLPMKVPWHLPHLKQASMCAAGTTGQRTCARGGWTCTCRTQAPPARLYIQVRFYIQGCKCMISHSEGPRSCQRKCTLNASAHCHAT